jgi:hypothetical protein
MVREYNKMKNKISSDLVFHFHNASLADGTKTTQQQREINAEKFIIFYNW